MFIFFMEDTKTRRKMNKERSKKKEEKENGKNGGKKILIKSDLTSASLFPSRFWEGFMQRSRESLTSSERSGPLTIGRTIGGQLVSD